MVMFYCIFIALDTRRQSFLEDIGRVDQKTLWLFLTKKTVNKT